MAVPAVTQVNVPAPSVDKMNPELPPPMCRLPTAPKSTLAPVNDALPDTVNEVSVPKLVMFPCAAVVTVPAVVALVAVVADPALPSMFTPVNDWLALERFNAIAVVPMYTELLPNTPLAIVPVKLPAGKLVNELPDPVVCR